jgi:hypothetical protein
MMTRKNVLDTLLCAFYTKIPEKVTHFAVRTYSQCDNSVVLGECGNGRKSHESSQQTASTVHEELSNLFHFYVFRNTCTCSLSPSILRIEICYRRTRIPVTLNFTLRQKNINLLHIFSAQFYDLGVLKNSLRFACPRNWNDRWMPFRPRQSKCPSNRYLSWCTSLLLSKLPDGIHKFQVGLEILVLESRQVTAGVSLRQIIRRRDILGKEAVAKSPIAK